MLLIALAVVPSTLMRPSVPFCTARCCSCCSSRSWGERLRRGSLGRRWAITAAAGGLALAAAPLLDRDHPWVDHEGLAGAVSPANVESFDWSQPTVR